MVAPVPTRLAFMAPLAWIRERLAFKAPNEVARKGSTGLREKGPLGDVGAREIGDHGLEFGADLGLFWRIVADLWKIFL